jgi:hypothetical protein
VGEEAGDYRVDARDVLPGEYQLALVPEPGGSVAATATVMHAPVTVTSRAEAGSAVARLVNVSAREVSAGVELRLRGGQRVDTVRAKGSAVGPLRLEIPAWATGLEVDIQMDREQWGRFTDFGVTVLDSLGRQIAQDPLEYAFGRLSTMLPESRSSTSALLSLYPGFADARDEREWSLVATVRLYADSAIPVASRGADRVTLTPAGRAEVRFQLPESPWPLPQGFVPLGVVLVREGEQVWTSEGGFARSER